MTVYVDDMYRYPIGRFGRMKMSHLVADDLDELLRMADRIGVARKWLQYPGMGRGRTHFDISVGKRLLAIKYGAVGMPMHELALMCGEWNRLNAERARMGFPPL